MKKLHYHRCQGDWAALINSCGSCVGWQRVVELLKQKMRKEGKKSISCTSQLTWPSVLHTREPSQVCNSWTSYLRAFLFFSVSHDFVFYIQAQEFYLATDLVILKQKLLVKSIFFPQTAAATLMHGGLNGGFEQFVACSFVEDSNCCQRGISAARIDFIRDPGSHRKIEKKPRDGSVRYSETRHTLLLQAQSKGWIDIQYSFKARCTPTNKQINAAVYHRVVICYSGYPCYTHQLEVTVVL